MQNFKSFDALQHIQPSFKGELELELTPILFKYDIVLLQNFRIRRVKKHTPFNILLLNELSSAVVAQIGSAWAN